MDTAERLQFIVRFVQMTLDALRPGDWLNLQDDLKTFVGYDRLPNEATAKDILALQTETRTLLDAFVLHSSVSNAETIQVDIHVQHVVSHHYPQLLTFGPLRDVVLEELVHLLKQPSASDDLRRCPECRTIFYRVRKQQYCSRRCTNRANVRQWRQSEAVKTQEQERAHARYKQEQKRKGKAGQGTKVDRKPRKGKTAHAKTPRES